VNSPKFKAPFLSKENIWSEADKFRSSVWPSTGIPIDVLQIVEFELSLEIRPIPRLKQECDVDALILGDWQTLVVDQSQYMGNRNINRLRFSIAHELGHLILHRSVFEQMPRGSVEEWIEFVRDMPEKEYSFLEYHAKEFSGRFLVPPAELIREFDAAILRAKQSGMSKSQLQDDACLSYLANSLSRPFQVSGDVMERRLTRENLWPLP